MAESTLSLAYNDFISKVGTFLGWGRGAIFGETAYTTQQQALLDDCVASGIRQFYFPPPLHPGGATYSWSFLKPVATLDFPTGVQTIQLPEDFGGIEGEITILSTSSNTVPWPVRVFNEASVREEYAKCPDATGPPIMAALQSLKGVTKFSSSRMQMFLYPMADQAYQIQFQYYILPDYLTGNAPYVYGGAQHVETILESCLAIAEQRIDDMAGLHSGKFMERLSASVGMDGKNKAAVIGYNGDRSDSRSRLPWFRNIQWGGCTYNGSTFDE